MKPTFCLFFILLLSSRIAFCQQVVTGTVVNNSLMPVAGARITIFNSDTSYFRETRTDALGAFAFIYVPPDNYTIGAEKISFDYKDTNIVHTSNTYNISFKLFPEAQKGKWDILFNTSPEPLGGTNLSALLQDGKIFYCHSTKDPFYFDSYKNDTMSFNGDTAVQGCVGPVLMPNGLIVFLGGALVDVYGPGSRKVKTYNPATNQWIVRSNMLDYRWYPSVCKLADNRILTAGGGNLNNPQRTNTCELYNPSTWTTQWTDTIAIGNEVSPIVLLYNNKVLMTHRPPQLFNPVTSQWDSAGQFVQSPRTPNGDHADHELVLMPDGEVIAVGYKSYTSGVYGTFIERYNPSTDKWSLGSSILPIRSRPKTVLLPDKNILSIGGYKENPADTTSTNAWGYMNLCDMYYPATDTWRRLSRTNFRREYHCNTILVPDGRVIVVGGEGQPGNEPPYSVIEAFKPPYLYRGVRPAITSLDTVEHARAEQINFTIQYTDSLSSVILISTALVTHFMNSGNNRYLELPFTQSGINVSATIPSDSVKAPDGLYMLFAMVDDVPSVGKIIRIQGNFISTDVYTVLQNNAHQISIYPTPCDDFISIHLQNTATKNFSITLSDMTGKSVTDKIVLNQSAFQLPIKKLSSGIYLLAVDDGIAIYRQKIVVQH